MNVWEALVGGIGTWKRGHERAVHKPLLTLMLLARAQRGGSNVVPYAEVHAALSKALVEFGPPRRRVHPELPFWYLKNDGFWALRGAEELAAVGPGRQPSHSALLAHEVVGVVPPGLWHQLSEGLADPRALARTLLSEFWPETYHEAIASHVGLDLEEARPGRGRDPRFREDVLRVYERRCAICGFHVCLGDAPVGLEAAHILFRQQGGPDEVRNGLALCALHHALFDRGGLSVDDDLRVLVSERLTGNASARATTLRHAGDPLRGPLAARYRPAPRFLKWHRDNVFQGPARAK